jgi:hypothetical protein
MRRPDELDNALKKLAQAFADVGIVLSVLRRFKRKADSLHQPLADELHTLQNLISRVLVLL